MKDRPVQEAALYRWRAKEDELQRYDMMFLKGLGLTAMLLVAGCAQQSSQAPPTARGTQYPYTTAVAVSATDTQAQIAQRYGGTVLVWQPDAGLAVLGLTHAPDSKRLQALGLTDLPVIEPNQNVYDASGTASAWAGQDPHLDAAGRAYVWSGGRAYVWSGGRAYVWSGGNGVVGGLSENSEAWNQIGLPAAWAAAPKLGEGVKVAVIDSGIDLNHEMFQGSLVDPADRWDFVGNDPVPQEEGGFTDEAFGHGTNVAGIVLQIAPHAKIMPLRVLSPDGSGDATTVAQAINFAVMHGAQVINLSLGSVEKADVIQKMITFANSKGINVVASSGNTGDERITFPAQQADGKYAMSVGSVDHGDHKSSFSTYGDKLDVTAPGEMVWGPVPGNLCSYWSGTSMAAPMVAGSVALARGQSLAVKPEELTDTLLRMSKDIQPLNPKYGKKLKRRLDVGRFIQAVTLP
ncbi:S8 family serine peptidase [Deinococcus sonorensis]|uniref:S8 family serine peptidase n=2 Tax=Deinococcus sonorensis TaxID=309891 RepID=A0AAU7UC93_9DEIO